MKVFPPFSLDAVNQCLWRGKERFVLAPKAFDVLRYLVDHAGRLVSQDELLDSLWPETYVQPEVLRKYILDIRKILGDRPKDPLFIETLPKRGYRFVAAVTEQAEGNSPVSVESAPASLVGRNLALAQLHDSLARSLRGQRQMIFVTGEAGIGKTALIDQFEEQARRQANLKVARGQCMEGFGGKEAYYPVLEALGQLVRGQSGAAVVATLAKQAPTWLIQFPGLLEAAEREALRREVLGATRERMLREICEALEVMTADAPLLLILEDLHWVDHSTLDLISVLARRRGPARLLLLATYRPVEIILSQSPLKALKQDLLIRRLCQEISLERLSEREVGQYLDARFPGHAFPAGLAALIHRHSDGNPLFMAVITDHMADKGAFLQDAGGWKIARCLEDIDPGVPDTLQQMLEIQFEQMDRSEQRLLMVSSVGGLRFTDWEAAAMLGDPPDLLEQLAAMARRQQFIRPAGTSQLPGGSVSTCFEFRHALYREFLYRQLSPPERRQLHRKVADRMRELCCPDGMAAEMALHFEAGGEIEQAIHYLVISSENAARRYARNEVISELRHALELVPAGAVALELDVRQRIAGAYYMLGDMLESGNAYQETAARAAAAGFPAEQVNALICAARPIAFVDPDACIAAAERAVEVATGLRDPILMARAQLLAARWRIVFSGWRREDAIACAQAVKTLRAAGNGSVSAKDLILGPQIQFLECDYKGALENAEACLPALATPETTFEYLAGLSAKTLALLGLGELGQAHRLLLEGIERSEKNGNAPWIAVFGTMLAYLKYHAFDFEGVCADCERILRPQAGPQPGPLWTLAMTSAALAEIELGKLDQAMERFNAIRHRASSRKIFMNWYWKMVAQFGITSAWLARGDLERARQEADQFVESALSCADRSLHALAWSSKALVVQMQGDAPYALDCVQRALSAIADLESPLVAWRVHAAAGELYAQAGQEAVADQHRAQSARIVLKLADSLEAGEPLRKSLLNHPPMRRLLSELSHSAG